MSNGLGPALLAALTLSCTDVVSLGSWTGQQVVTSPPTGPSQTLAPPQASAPDAAMPPPQASAPVTSSIPTEVSSAPTPIVDAGPPIVLEAGPPLDASVLDTPDAGDAGTEEPAGMPACNALATPGDISGVGIQFAATETSTDWTWSSPADSIQWDLMIEGEVERPTETSPGYYWAHQFWFERGVTGIIGLQDEGKYQSDPPGGTAEWTKMAVFWLSGPPIDAEYGEIGYPNARIYTQPAAGLNWTTIHAKFEWVPCHIYQMRFAPDTTEAGSTWYGAWITDRTTGKTTLLGRMLLPQDAGQISPYSVSRTTTITREPTSCEPSPRVSAIFGKPTAVDGSRTHSEHGNRFTTPAGCRRSRFTDFPDAVRHEVSVE